MKIDFLVNKTSRTESADHNPTDRQHKVSLAVGCHGPNISCLQIMTDCFRKFVARMYFEIESNYHLNGGIMLRGNPTVS